MKIDWYMSSIDSHLTKIKELFLQNADHRLAKNYLDEKECLFNFTKFSRMGYSDEKMIYYSAGIERPQYNGSIRIMSRHTRDRNFDFGNKSLDLKRGLETLELSTEHAKELGYTNIWVSREFSPKLFEWFAKHSKYNWNVSHELLHNGRYQYILRLIDK